MEAVFANLEKDGKNDVDSLVKWVKDSKVIDQSNESENKVRGLFDGVPDKQNVTLDQFKDVMKKIAEEFKFDLDGITNKLAEIGPKLLQDFAGGGATSSLAAKIIETKDQEEKVRNFFADVADKKNVSVEKFVEVMKKLQDYVEEASNDTAAPDIPDGHVCRHLQK